MPIAYEFDPNSGILHSYHYGRLTASGYCEYFHQVIDDPTVTKGYIDVVHFAHDAVFDFTSHDARKIPIHYAELKSKKNITATIFIGATQLQYGIARMVKNLHEVFDPENDIRVVRTLDEVQNEINSIILAQDESPGISCA